MTKRNAARLAFGLVFGLAAFAAFAQPELIVNGSFESGGKGGVEYFPGWDQIGPADNHSDYGTVQATVFPDAAEQGNFYAYFHGKPTDSSQDCLGQTVNLTVGAQYTVSFYLATDGTTLGSGAAMWAVIGTSFGINYDDDLSLAAFLPNSSNAIPYQQITTNFIATQPSEILSFHGVDATSSILLDNVSLKLTVPSLNLSLSPTNTLVFNWTSYTSGYQIQASTSLSTTNWVKLTNTPSTVGTSNQIVLPAPSDTAFYRLLLP